MSSPENLLNDAQYHFGNISPGATRSGQHRSKAERLLRTIIRKYPASTEGGQAQAMLDQLNGIQRAAIRRPLPHLAHTPASPHRSHKDRPPPRPSPKPSAAPRARKLSQDQVSKIAEDIRAASKRTFATSGSKGWGDLMRKFSELSYVKKRALGFILLFVGFVVTAFPVLLLGLFFYATKPSRIAEHLHALLDSLS